MKNKKIKNIRLLPTAIILLFISQSIFAQKVVRYDLYVRDTIVTFGDKPKRAIAVNGLFFGQRLYLC